MSGDSWRDARAAWVRYVEELARAWGREQEAKTLARREIRELRVYEQRLRKIALS